MSEPRRASTEEFKREAVQLAMERGNISAVARELGIHESVLNRWKSRLEQETEHSGTSSRPFPGKGNARDEELASLKRELARVKEENAILKRLSLSSPTACGEIPVCAAALGAVSGNGAMPGYESHPQRLLRLAGARIQ